MTHYGVFDGSLYATAGTETIHNGTELDLEFRFRYGLGSLGGKRDFGIDGKTEFYTRFLSATSFQFGNSRMMELQQTQ